VIGAHEHATAETFELLERHLSPARAAALRVLGAEVAQGAGEGVWLRTLDGRRLLDCRSAGGVFDFGHRPAALTAALREALDEGDLGDWMLPSLQRGRAARALAGILPDGLDRCVLTTSGSEAVEVAGRLARAATSRRRVVCAQRAYHGQVGLAHAMTQGPGPPPARDDVVKVPFGDLAALEAAVDNRTALVFLETIPASAGVLVPPNGYLAGARRLCDRHGTLLGLDEVQAGLGRTGRTWAAEHWGAVPDLLVCGKGLSGGLYPVAACCLGPAAHDAHNADPFFYPSSFGGSQLAAVVVCAVVDHLRDPALLPAVRARGDQLHRGLRSLVARRPDVLLGARGLGLMAGLQTRDAEAGETLMRAAIGRGVLATVAHNSPDTLLVMPPLIITADEIEHLLAVLEQAVDDLAAYRRTHDPGDAMTTQTVTTDKPSFLTDFTPSRGLRRLTPFSRRPATGHYGEAWHVAADRHPGQLLFLQRAADIATDGRTDYTYADWAGLVDEATAWLHAAGVQPWDRVAIMKANHPDVQVIGSAAARIGAVPAQLAWNHGPHFAQTMLRRLQRPVLVTDRERLELAGLDRDTLAALTKATIVIDADSSRPDVLALVDLRGTVPPPPAMRAWDEPMVITHTSGTTGVPKLSMHSAQTMHAVTHVETERWLGIGLRATDTLAFGDPFFHQRTISGLLASATVGPKLVLLSDPMDSSVGDLVAAHVPTVFETLPNIYLAWEPLTRDPRRPLRDVRLFVNSFDAIHTRTIRAFMGASERRMCVWLQSWSQTENGGLVLRPYLRRSVRRVGRRPPPTQRLGWPLRIIAKMRAVDPQTGKPVPAGQVGLIEIDQPGRCLAYVGEQDRHDNKVDGWWWNTGDLGTISKLGTVRLVDREVDRIPGASGIELEDVLLDRLPETTEVIVLARTGELPVPVYSTQNGTPVDDRAWARATGDLPAMAPPIHLAWDELPRTATWKVRRVELRERLFGEQPVGLGRWT
jgi:acetylornithine/succinyldiaminopimelate/putrescine aminotransferase/acyl-coenzyme A synthetase/AMP-(fatty) acid ligase